MIQKLKESSGKATGFKFSGELTDKEYKGFVVDVEAIIADHGKARLLSKSGLGMCKCEWLKIGLTLTILGLFLSYAIIVI
jgi:hypothetical protein